MFRRPSPRRELGLSFAHCASAGTELGGKPLCFLVGVMDGCMSSEHFGQLAWQFKRVSGSSGLKVQAAIACYDNYTGPAFDPAEGERLAKVLGNKTVLFMANHGVATVGQSVADAYNRLYYIERAAQVQIYAMWTGQRLKQVPEAVVEKTKNEIGGARFYKGPTPAERHFCALKRILDREEADYAS